MSEPFKTRPASRAHDRGMDDTYIAPRIGLGLPAAIPDVSATAVAEWAAVAEELGFASVGVIDRLVYDNLDPVVALAAAAAVTRRVELLTTVLNVPWRESAMTLAKQLASLDRISDGRLVAGMGLGGWPEDYRESGTAATGRGDTFDAMLDVMSRAWSGAICGASGPLPALPAGRPTLLFGGFAERSYRRAATRGSGWVAPSFGFDALLAGIAAMNAAWSGAGRRGRPRTVVARYFCLGPGADTTADEYIHHYYGDPYFAAARADTITSDAHLQREMGALRDAGCHDVVLLPCSADIDQAHRLATALAALGEPMRATAAAR